MGNFRDIHGTSHAFRVRHSVLQGAAGAASTDGVIGFDVAIGEAEEILLQADLGARAVVSEFRPLGIDNTHIVGSHYLALGGSNARSGFWCRTDTIRTGRLFTLPESNNTELRDVHNQLYVGSAQYLAAPAGNLNVGFIFDQREGKFVVLPHDAKKYSSAAAFGVDAPAGGNEVWIVGQKELAEGGGAVDGVLWKYDRKKID